MVYLFESEIKENKSLIFALSSVYGLNKSTSIKVCKLLGFSFNLKTENLSKEQLNKLVLTLDSINHELGTDLKKTKALSFKKLISIKSYRGFRRHQGLPVRGQRTHTNANTAKKRNKKNYG